MEVRLRPRGFGRSAAAAFLGFWLCGWVAGEVMVLGLLVALAVRWITGEPAGQGLEPPGVGAGILGAGFIVVWLIGWTFGGVLAIRQLFRSVWAEDRIVAAGHGLIVERRNGPFRSTREIPRDALVAVRSVRGNGPWIAETRSGSVALSDLGTLDERDAAASTLSNQFGLTTDPADGPQIEVPRGWEEIVTPRGEVVLVEETARRRKFAHGLLGLSAIAAVIALVLVRDARAHDGLGPVSALVCAAALALGCGAERLDRTRKEWRVERGTRTLRKRSGARVREVFRAVALELVARTDGDGDRGYRLHALPFEPDIPPRRISHTIDDPLDMQRLGRWIARRTGLPFADGSAIEDDGVDLETVKTQLAEQGRLGRWIVRWIERVESRRKAV